MSCFFSLDTDENFKYTSSEHEHTAGYDATCTAICMTKMMAYIGIIVEKDFFSETRSKRSESLTLPTDILQGNLSDCLIAFEASLYISYRP